MTKTSRAATPNWLPGDWLITTLLLISGALSGAGGVYSMATGHVRGGRAAGLTLVVFAAASLWCGRRVAIERVSWSIFAMAAALLLAADPIDWWMYEQGSHDGSNRGYDWYRSLLITLLLLWWLAAIMWRRRQDRRGREVSANLAGSGTT